MCLLKLVVFCLLCTRVRPSELEALIRRVQDEIGLVTVHILGDDKTFYDNFTSFGSDIAVSVQKSEAPSLFVHNCILVVPVLRDNDQIYKAVLPHFVSHLRVRKFVIIVASSFDDFYKPFAYFHKKKFSRIFGVAGGICYAYLPYAHTPVQRIPAEGPLPNAFTNLNGLAIRSDIVECFPQAFWFPDGQGYYRLGGAYGHLMEVFIRKCNATLKEVDISGPNGVSVTEVIDALKTDKIDISSRVFSSIRSLDCSYPLKFQQYRVIVPIPGLIHPSELFTRPFSPATWLAIGIVSVYITLMDYVKDMWVDVRQNVWKSFCRIFFIFMGGSIQPPVTSAYRFYALVLMFAFILNNIYLISFTHFMTVSIRGKQYNTVQDLIDNKIRVLVPEEDRSFFSLLDHSAAIDSLIIFIDTSEFFNILSSMSNTSFPFVAGDDYANLLIRMQRVFTEPRFHTTRDGLRSFGQLYLMTEHSPFKDILDRIIFQVNDAGLVQGWDRAVVWESIRTGQMFNSSSVHRDRRPMPLNLRDLSFAWICLTIGCVMSLIVFVGEALENLFSSKHIEN